MSKYIHKDLGELKEGLIVEVSLEGNGANVRLLDAYNFAKYQKGEACQFIGGAVRVTPARITVPRQAHWHVAVDMHGLSGSTSAIIRVLKPK